MSKSLEELKEELAINYEYCKGPVVFKAGFDVAIKADDEIMGDEKWTGQAKYNSN